MGSTSRGQPGNRGANSSAVGARLAIARCFAQKEIPSEPRKAIATMTNPSIRSREPPGPCSRPPCSTPSTIPTAYTRVAARAARSGRHEPIGHPAQRVAVDFDVDDVDSV